MTNTEIEQKTKEWHESNCKRKLHEYLGISLEEYAAYVECRRSEEGFINDSSTKPT